MALVTVSKLHNLTGHNDAVYTVKGVGNGAIFYSGSGDGMVVEWDLRAPENGRLIAQLPNSVYAMDLDPSSKLLAVGHNYEGVHFIRTDQQKEVGSAQLTKGAIYDIKFWKNLLIICTGEGEVIFFDPKKMSEVARVKASDQSARCCDINYLHREMAVGFSDNKIRLFDLDTLEITNEFEAHQNSVFTVRYSPDYNQVLSGSRDAHLKVWSLQEEPVLLQSIVAHMYTINHLDFSPDGKHFVTCSMDKSIKVWDAQRYKLLKVIDKARHAGHGTSVNKLLWTSFQNQIVSCSDDRTISVWDLEFNNES